jgi:hypothetical protein
MAPHVYAITDIAVWILHWLYQYILDIAPLIAPVAESPSPPVWWWRFYGYFDWSNNLGSGSRPSSYLIELALSACWRLVGLWVEEVGAYVYAHSQEYVRLLTGHVPARWDNLSAWSTFLNAITGDYVPSWTSTLGAGLWFLYDRLPVEIRSTAASWSQLFGQIKADVQAWVAMVYNPFAERAQAAYDWFVYTGVALEAWYNLARGELDALRADPAGWITSHLGAAWPRLAAFESGPLTYLYNLWSRHSDDLSEFLHDPVGFLYDRVEAWVINHVW